MEREELLVVFSDLYVETGLETGCEPVEEVDQMESSTALAAMKTEALNYPLPAHHGAIPMPKVVTTTLIVIINQDMICLPCGLISKAGVWDDNTSVDSALLSVDAPGNWHPMKAYGAYLEEWLVYKSLTTQRKSMRDSQYPKRVVTQA